MCDKGWNADFLLYPAARLVSGVDSIELLIGVRHDGVCPRSRRGCGSDVGAQVFPRGGHVNFRGYTINFPSDAVPGELHAASDCFGDLKRDVGRTTSGTA